MGLIIKILIIGFFINLLYELLHSVLYKTCLEASLRKYTYLMLKAALFDGLVIGVVYYISYLIFNNVNPFLNTLQLTTFLLLSLTFAYAWEIYSLRREKWEYASNMPLFLAVGVTPLLQLVLTGICTLYIVFNFY